jgi:hypothetical protein
MNSADKTWQMWQIWQLCLFAFIARKRAAQQVVLLVALAPVQ